VSSSLTQFKIGGEPSCEVTLNLPQVSGYHAECTWDGTQWLLRDLGSTNGTTIDGRPVGERSEPVSLKAMVGLGSATYSVDALVVMATLGAYEQRWTLGANPDCDILETASPVSGYHARVYQVSGQHYIIDLGSTNGTSVDGQVVAGHPALVQPHSRVLLGSHSPNLGLLRAAPAPAAAQPVSAPRSAPPGTYIIGGESYCSIQLAHAAVSAKHALLSVSGHHALLYDLGSTNGTSVDGVSLSDAPAQISAQSRISLGSYTTTLSELHGAIRGGQAARLIGAHPGADWLLDDPKVSSVHAAVVEQRGGFAIVDLASSNGVFVDGKRVKRTTLRPQDQVTLGNTTIDGASLLNRVGLSVPNAPTQESPAAAAPGVGVPLGASSAPHRDPAQAPTPAGPGGAQPPGRGASPPSGGGTTPPPSRPRYGAMLFAMLFAIASVGAFAYVMQQDESVDIDDDPPAPDPTPTPTPIPGPTPAPPDNLPGQSAWQVLRRANTLQAQLTSEERDGAFALEAVDRSVEKESGTPVSEWLSPSKGLVDFLRTQHRGRLDHDSSQYQLIELLSLGSGEGGDLSNASAPSRQRYQVPRLKRVPVRNQKRRPTCAAFAGVGNIEYTALKQDPSRRRPLPFSEQYFYYLSKPECQQGQCPKGQSGGSRYEKGFRASRIQSGLDIPLESDCPYGPYWKNNEVQAPMRDSCERGAVDVVSVKRITSMNGLIRSLEQDRVPIPIGTRLSSNWMSGSGRGFYSMANSGPPRRGRGHMAGHAYLIVGYKAVPSLPQEGGLCFIVKNSWGRSWGDGGYSCVTQAWLATYGGPYLFPTEVVTQVKLRADLQPNRPPPPKPKPKPRPKPKATWRSVTLKGPNHVTYMGETKSAPKALELRGVLSQGGAMTSSLKLVKQGKRLYFSRVQVGRIEGQTVTLCAGPYDATCALRYYGSGQRLAIHIRDASYGHQLGSSASDLPFVEVLRLPSLGVLQVQAPDSINPKRPAVRVRYVPEGGEPTPELEIAIEQGTDLVVAGRTVGSVRPDRLGLCTGPYQDACDVMLSDDGIVILPFQGSPE
jgi:pSer/pThr/pTyr-binding forkhead associated (FHA) protein